MQQVKSRKEIIQILRALTDGARKACITSVHVPENVINKIFKEHEMLPNSKATHIMIREIYATGYWMGVIEKEMMYFHLESSTGITIKRSAGETVIDQRALQIINEFAKINDIDAINEALETQFDSLHSLKQ